MIRAVLDTNVIVSALIWGGVPFRLFAAAEEGNVQLVSSPALIAEFERILRRPRFEGPLRRAGRSVESALATYAELVTSVTPAVVERVVKPIRMTTMSSPPQLPPGLT